ncbi:MAG: winged helix-turn-helix domain-containing protein [Candidatus Promineifilaceae bacterium]
MTGQMPRLDVQGPEGQHFKLEANTDRVTIGRFGEHNDIGLEPDPQQLVSRMRHCTVEREAGVWWVIDNGSVNKTFLCRDETVQVVDGKAILSDGDSIRILGRLTEEGEPYYWQITFHDPLRTQPAEIISDLAFLHYEWIQAKLYRFDGRARQEIVGLRPQEHKLIRFMDQRNRANDYVPVMCTYVELIEAVWGDDAYGHTESDINRLVWELRQKIEIDQKEPQFLQVVRGLGYRLVSRA